MLSPDVRCYPGYVIIFYAPYQAANLDQLGSGGYFAERAVSGVCLMAGLLGSILAQGRL